MGTTGDEGNIFCMNCGASIPSTAKYCFNCGTKLQVIGPAPVEAQSKPVKTSAPSKSRALKPTILGALIVIAVVSAAALLIKRGGDGDVINVPSVDTVNLRVHWSGCCGTVTRNPAGTSTSPSDCPDTGGCTYTYDPGTSVALTASGTSDEYVFVGWSGACNGVEDCVLRMDVDKEVTAAFETPAPPVRITETYVAKSPATGAIMKFYVLNTDGTKGDLLATGTEDAGRSYSASLTTGPDDQILVEASGGSFMDEATGAFVTLKDSDVLTAVFPTGTTSVTVTFLAHMAATRARALASAGIPIGEAVFSSNIGVAQQYNLASIIDIAPAAPNDPTQIAAATREERNYGLVLAGMAQAAKSLNVRTIDLAASLASDIADGLLDGKKSGSAVTIRTIAGGSVPLISSTGTADLQSAINTFIASPNNKITKAQMSIPLQAMTVGVNVPFGFYATSTVLPAAVTGQPYSYKLLATGGTPPYHWKLKEGSSLPGQLRLLDDGTITGTAPVLASGTDMRIAGPIKVIVADSGNPKGTDELELFLTIVSPPPTLKLTEATCVVNAQCSVQVATATGGSPPYSFRSEPLAGPPLALSVNMDGFLTGKPAAATNVALPKTYTYGICVVDMIASSSCDKTTVTVIKGITIKGVVTDSRTTEPIGDAKISISFKNQEGKEESITAISEFDGSYSVDISKIDSATVAAEAQVGLKRYKPFKGDYVNLEPGHDNIIDIALDPLLGMELRGKITDKDTGELIVGAAIKIAYQDERGKDSFITASSSETPIDKYGNNYVVFLPDYLPSNVIVNVDGGEKYLPASANVFIDTGLLERNTFGMQHFELTPLSEKLVMIDSALTHLGDDSFAGSINSQFQRSAQGTSYTHQFTIPAAQLGFSGAKLFITSRGAELNNPLNINGKSVGSLCCSPGDGSFGKLYWTFDPATVLREGQNTISVNSVIGESYDDFEFTQVMIEFS